MARLRKKRENVQNNNDADADDATTIQEPSSLHWSDPLSGEEFILSFWIIPLISSSDI